MYGSIYFIFFEIGYIMKEIAIANHFYFLYDFMYHLSLAGQDLREKELT